MDLETAKSQFMNFSQTIANDADRFHFFNWLSKEVLPVFERQQAGVGNFLKRYSILIELSRQTVEALLKTG